MPVMMKCARCGWKESKQDGYCSVECQDMHAIEQERDFATRKLSEAEEEICQLKSEVEYLEDREWLHERAYLIAEKHRLQNEVNELRALADLAGAQLSMVGSELCRDPKIDPEDTGDPRNTPTLREARRVRMEQETLRLALGGVTSHFRCAPSADGCSCETHGYALPCPHTLARKVLGLDP